MALSDVAVRQAKAEGKVEKISDGRGLYLEIRLTGSKYWCWLYGFDGKQKTLARKKLTIVLEKTGITKQKPGRGIWVCCEISLKG